MKRLPLILITLLGPLLLIGCGPTHHVFPPEISVQQVRVSANGDWNLTVRMQNYSYDSSVHFDHVHAELSINKMPTATFDIHPDLDVAQKSADVAHVTIRPDTAARKALAAATGTLGVAYTIKGQVQVTGEDSRKPSDFPIDHHGWLSPVPGIANTYR